jgi:hypothetical protein
MPQGRCDVRRSAGEMGLRAACIAISDPYWGTQIAARGGLGAIMGVQGSEGGRGGRLGRAAGRNSMIKPPSWNSPRGLK